MSEFFSRAMQINESVPDIPYFYTALAEAMFCVMFVVLNKKRCNALATFFICLAFTSLIIGFHEFRRLLPLQLWLVGMLLAIVIMFLFIFSACAMNVVTAAYNTIRAFIMAEFTASLEWQFNYYLAVNIKVYVGAFPYMFLAIVYIGLFIMFLINENRYKKNGNILSIEKKDLFSAIAIAIVVFAISNVSFVSSSLPISSKYAGEIFYIRTLVDLCGIILFTVLQEKILWYNEKRTVALMQQMLDLQYSQYYTSQASIDLINRKYHDLKHQIAAIKAEISREKQLEYLNEIEEDIKTYEAQNKTGNKVLDSILSAKSLICAKENINFTCVADGTALENLKVTDICSIVGNALDNAIEYEKTLQDEEKRLIKVAIYAQGNLIVMRFENYFEGEFKEVDGSIATSKADKQNHGFGLKSMRFTAEKYGGVMKYEKKGSWFSLSFVIPVKS